MSKIWDRLADLAYNKSKVVLIAVIVLAAVLGIGITQLKLETNVDSVLSKSNPVYTQNQEYQEAFGGDPIILVLRANDKNATADDLWFNEDTNAALRQLGARFDASDQYFAAFNPITNIEWAADAAKSAAGELLPVVTQGEPEVTQAVADADTAADANGDDLPDYVKSAIDEAGGGEAYVEAQLAESQARIANGFGILTARLLPVVSESIDSSPALFDVVLRELPDTGQPPEDYETTSDYIAAAQATGEMGDIRRIYRLNYPSETVVTIVLSMQPNVSLEDAIVALDEARTIVASQCLANKGEITIDADGKPSRTVSPGEMDDCDEAIPGWTAQVTGQPALLEFINDYLTTGINVMGGAALIMMFLVLGLVFRVRSRLLSLFVVLLGTIMTFGIMGITGIPLTMVTISGLPIFVGMGVDFSIQVHSRFEEEVEEDGDAEASLHRTLRSMGPPLFIAILAALGGFMSLQLSEVPMIRQYGIMLAIGVGTLAILAFFVPPAFLAMREKRSPTPARTDFVKDSGIEAINQRLGTLFEKWVMPMAIVCVVITIAGFWADNNFKIQTDPADWAGENTTVVKDLRAVESELGAIQSLGFHLRSKDQSSVIDSELFYRVWRWANAETERYDDIVRPLSAPEVTGALTASAPTAEAFNIIDPFIPPKIRAAIVSPDNDQMNLLFLVKSGSLTEQKKLIDQLEADLDAELAQTSLAGNVDFYASGITVVGIELVESLQSGRAEMTFLSVLFVIIVLALMFRKPMMVLLPLIPVIVGIALSSLLIYLMGIELSPLTTVTGPLTVAACTEFSVLIMARYVEERERGLTPGSALNIAAARTGRAFVASGLTTVFGFGILAFSELELLRSFGIVVAVNVITAILVALVVLPPFLLWADRNPKIKSFKPGGGDAPMDSLGDAQANYKERVKDAPVGEETSA
ncbi:MAG: RND family transporter [Actinobacteria bacterium]|nr:RND family transporter [Actinomycetota bacterium]MCB9388802.1 RND family transporter [Acidimicrobiia bacterium]